MREGAMPNEPLPDDLFRVWQNQPVENTPMPLEEIRRKARKFEMIISSRNRREYIAAVIVVIGFTYYFFHFSDSLIRAGSVLIIAGTLFAMYQLYKKSSPGAVPADLGLTASLEFHRRELERQRELLQSVWKWYLAPLYPGLLVFTIGTMPKRGRGMALFGLICAMVFGAGFVWSWWINRRAADRITRQIEELDNLGGQL